MQARDRDRRQQIVRVEPADEAGRQGPAPPRRCDFQRKSGCFPDDAAPHRRRGGGGGAPVAEGQRDGFDTGRQGADQIGSERIVGVDRRMREARQLEQGRLGARVGAQVRVIVEVIAAQVGEHRGVDPHRFDPALIERVRRDLHGEHVDPGLRQRRKPAVDLDRARGGEGRGVQLPRPAGAQSAHHRASIAAAPRREMRDARLSVRPGHRGNGQARRRISVEARRGMSHRAREVGDRDRHRPSIEPRRRRRPLGDYRRGAGRDRAGREPTRVDPPAPAREEQRSRAPPRGCRRTPPSPPGRAGRGSTRIPRGAFPGSGGPELRAPARSRGALRRPGRGRRDTDRGVPQ